jgi:hypothetical protein
MRSALHKSILISMLLALSGCTLPGAASPTPFTFPTPNLTHTAIFAATATGTQPPPTLPPLESPTPLPSATELGAPTATTGPSPTHTPVPAETVTAAYLTAPPVIDGDLDDWSGPAYSVDRPLSYASAGWTGTSDLSARFYLGWDVNYLYLGVERFDDLFVQAATGRYLYRGDDVEIQLDADLAGDQGSTSLSSDDYQIGLSPGNFDGLPPEAYLWYPRSREGGLSNVSIKGIKQGQGYTLEARIPWSIFGVTPEENDQFGFVLALSDNDQAGVAAWQSMIANVPGRRLADPTTWGLLVLGPPSAK